MRSLPRALFGLVTLCCVAALSSAALGGCDDNTSTEEPLDALSSDVGDPDPTLLPMLSQRPWQWRNATAALCNDTFTTWSLSSDGAITRTIAHEITGDQGSPCDTTSTTEAGTFTLQPPRAIHIDLQTPNTTERITWQAAAFDSAPIDDTFPQSSGFLNTLAFSVTADDARTFTRASAHIITANDTGEVSGQDHEVSLRFDAPLAPGPCRVSVTITARSVPPGATPDATDTFDTPCVIEPAATDGWMQLYAPEALPDVPAPEPNSAATTAQAYALRRKLLTYRGRLQLYYLSASPQVLVSVYQGCCSDGEWMSTSEP